MRPVKDAAGKASIRSVTVGRAPSSPPGLLEVRETQRLDDRHQDGTGGDPVPDLDGLFPTVPAGQARRCQ